MATTATTKLASKAFAAKAIPTANRCMYGELRIDTATVRVFVATDEDQTVTVVRNVRGAWKTTDRLLPLAGGKFMSI